MIFLYRCLKKLLDLIINIIFVTQIILMATIFLTASYWLFNLINLNLFDFAKPLADWVTQLVMLTYKKEVILSGTTIDGTILFFDIVALIFTFLITAAKGYLYKFVEIIEYKLIIKKKKSEQEMNEKLQEESLNLIKKYKKAAVVIEFHAKNSQVDKFWGGDPDKDVQENTMQAVREFYSNIKSLSGCSFVKTNNQVAIIINNFEMIDKILICMQEILAEIKNNMGNNHWEIVTYSAVDAFYDIADFKNDVYPAMDKLLKLNIRNEIVCYGNFSLRYNLEPESTSYLVVLKGAYAMGKDFGTHSVFTLVKKN